MPIIEPWIAFAKWKREAMTRKSVIIEMRKGNKEDKCHSPNNFKRMKQECNNNSENDGLSKPLKEIKKPVIDAQNARCIGHFIER